MIPLVLWLLSFVAPSLDRLGCDDFETREKETERCDCFPLALLLPALHEDAEVNHRVQWLRTRNLKLIRGEWWERVARKHDYGLWFDLWFAPNRSRVPLAEVHADLAVWSCKQVFDGRWDDPFPADGWAFWWFGVTLAEFSEACDFHRFVVPAPREK
jgi:hypothetical protein